MKKVLFLLSATLILSACGNEKEKEEPKKETQPKENKKETQKSKEDVKQPQQKSDEQGRSQKQTVEQSQQKQTDETSQQEASASYDDKNTVTEYYNGQSHTTTNNPVRDNYDSGETDPIYEHEYKHFYTPEEAQKAQENSDATLREMGLEPGTYE